MCIRRDLVVWTGLSGIDRPRSGWGFAGRKEERSRGSPTEVDGGGGLGEPTPTSSPRGRRVSYRRPLLLLVLVLPCYPTSSLSFSAFLQSFSRATTSPLPLSRSLFRLAPRLQDIFKENWPILWPPFFQPLSSLSPLSSPLLLRSFIFSICRPVVSSSLAFTRPFLYLIGDAFYNFLPAAP